MNPRPYDVATDYAEAINEEVTRPGPNWRRIAEHADALRAVAERLATAAKPS